MGERLDDVRRNPKSVRTETLVAVLEAAGFVCRRTASGHWLCRHAALSGHVGFAEPHGKGDSFVKAVYVRRALSAIDELDSAGGNDHG